MALTEIITVEGEAMVDEVSRGNVGLVQDVQSALTNTVEIPQSTQGGGNIFIMSE